MARKRKHKPQKRKPATTGKRLHPKKTRTELGQNLDPGGRPLPKHRPDPRIDKAQAAWKARRYDEAIWYYERALARSPNNAVLLVDLARAYGLRFRFAEAEELVDKASAMHPNDAPLQRMLGRSYEMLKQFDRAIERYHRALVLDPDSADQPRVLLELAKMQERLHDLEAARGSAMAAIELAPNLGQAHYALAIIEQRAGDGESARARLERLVESETVSAGVVADSWYQLASMHDRAGRFHEAFDALLRAKRILSQAAPPYREDAATISKKNLEMRRVITADHFRRWQDAGVDLKPFAGGLSLLTSHPRSGTTLLEQVLDSHAQLVSADELQIMAELVFTPLGQRVPGEFSVPEMLDRAATDDINQARRVYWTAMEGALRESIGDRILLDKNPELTNLLPLVGRVFPEMSVLYALRDPRDVVISCFMQRLPLNLVSVYYLSLEETAKKYATTMRTWLKLRDVIQNRWIEVRYEDTVANLEGQARRVLDFLECPWDDSVLNFHQRAQQKHVHSPTYEAVTRPIYHSSVGRWQNYAEYLEPVQKTLQPFVEAFGYG